MIPNTTSPDTCGKPTPELHRLPIRLSSAQAQSSPFPKSRRWKRMMVRCMNTRKSDTSTPPNLKLPIFAHESTSRTPPPFFHPSHTSVAIGTFPRMGKTHPRCAQVQSCLGPLRSSARQRSSQARTASHRPYLLFIGHFLYAFSPLSPQTICSALHSTVPVTLNPERRTSPHEHISFPSTPPFA